MASLEDRISKPAGTEDEKAAESWADDNGQLDGSSSFAGGSGMAQPEEYEVQVKLIDENSPLYSVKTFEELGFHENILKGIYKMRFQRPSKIQEKALPLLINDPPTNLIGQSQSGTGKTAAFTLNLLARLDMSSEQARTTPQALVLAPTRELARQIIGVIQVMGSFIEGLHVSAAIPVEASQRGQVLNGQIVVGTPGTTMDLIKKRLMDARQLKTLVLDEADNMLDQQGMGDQCLRLKRMLPQNVQVVLFSATFPAKVVGFAQKFAPQANELTLQHEELTVEGIRQLYIDCSSDEEKYNNLVKLYGLMTIGSSIIFVKRRDTADKIETRMKAEGHTVASLTGAFEGAVRDGIIDSFRNGSAKVLIATNVLARGIDVQSVSLVINYDIPDMGGYPPRPDPQTYLHRIGRTGRFGRVGAAISFVHDRQSWEFLTEITDYFKVKLQKLDTSDWDEVEAHIKKIIQNPAADPTFQPQRASVDVKM